MIEGAFLSEVPKFQIIHPQSELLLEHINSAIPEGSSPITSENGRFNKKGKTLSEDLYGTFLKRTNNNFKEMLNICRDAEQQIQMDEESGDNKEILKVIRSIRGKVVYNAHKTFAEKQMLIDNFGDKSASNIMWYAKIAKLDARTDVYDEATQIALEKQHIDIELTKRNKQLEKENDQIISDDHEVTSIQEQSNEESKNSSLSTKTKIKNNLELIIRNAKDKAHKFIDTLVKPTTRRKIISGALATLLSGGAVYETVTNLDNIRSVLTNLSKNTVALTNNITEDKKPLIKSTQKYRSNSEVHVKNNYETREPKDLFSMEYMNSTDEIPQEQQSKKNKNFQQIDISNESLIMVDSKHPLTKEYIDKEIVPNLITIKEKYPNIRVMNEKTQINEICGDDLNTMLMDAESIAIGITIRSAFRSFEQQQIAFSQATDKTVVAIPGESQHHTGLAIDFTSPEIGNIVDVNSGFGNTKAGKWLVDNAYKYGFVLSYTNNHDGIHNEDWHYFYVGKDLALIWHNSRLAGENIDIFELQEQFALTQSTLVAMSP